VFLLVGGPMWSVGRERGERRVARWFVRMGVAMLLVGLVLLLVSLFV